MDEKIKEIEKLISEVYSDTSVSMRCTIERMESIRDFCQENIEAAENCLEDEDEIEGE